jgi:hypothetical protein
MTTTSNQTERAIGRLQGQSSASIKLVLENAKRASNDALTDACEKELRIRGSFEMSEAEAKQMVEAIGRSAGKSLLEVIEIAFSDVPAKPEEVLILRWIALNPGTTFAATAKAYGRNDLALVIGHLVYYRFGYFRPFIESATQSDLLLVRTPSPAGVSYTLRPEAAEALAKVGVIFGS